MSNSEVPTTADHLSNEVAIAGKLESKQLSVSARSRFVSAADRLLGSIFDLPTSYVEGLTERVRANNKKKLAQIGKHSVHSSVDLESLDDAMLAAHAEELSARQIENRAAIVEKSIDYLDDGNSGEIPELDGAWLSEFQKFADNATTDRMRNFWAKILAGEVSAPGSFSPSTLRAVSNLDKETALTFQDLVGKIIDFEFVPSPSPLEGKYLVGLMAVEAAGLIQGATGTLSRTFNPLSLSDGSTAIYAKSGRVECNPLPALLLRSEKPLMVPGVFLTKAGQELARILPDSDPLASLRNLFEIMNNPSASEHITASADIVRAETLPNGTTTFSIIEHLETTLNNRQP